MKVLVVDDDDLVRGTAVAIIEDAGFEVLEASTAAEAFEIVSAEPSAISHVITDVRMPGVGDGVDLAHAVKEEFPHIGVTITSGYTDRRDEAFMEGAYYLQKPWHRSELLEVIGAESV